MFTWEICRCLLPSFSFLFLVSFFLLLSSFFLLLIFNVCFLVLVLMNWQDGQSLDATEKATTMCVAGACTKTVCQALGLTDCLPSEVYGEVTGCLPHCKNTLSVCQPLVEFSQGDVTPFIAKTKNGANVQLDLQLQTLVKPKGCEFTRNIHFSI